MSRKVVRNSVASMASELYEEHVSTGMSYAEIARRRGLNPNTVRRAVSEFLRSEIAAANSGADVTAEELAALAEINQLFMEAVDPTPTHGEISIDSEFVAILFAGCFHLGGRWTFHAEMRKWIDRVMAHEFTRVGLFGDEIDNFIGGARTGAWASYEQALNPILQRFAWERWLDRISGKVLWATTSQHGTKWDRMRGFSPISDSYRRRGIPVYTSGYINLRVGEVTYRVAIAHEFPGRSMYNPVHALFRALWQRYPNADIIAQADRHINSYACVPYGIEEYIAGNRNSAYAHLIQIGTLKGGPEPYTMSGWGHGYVGWWWVCLGGRRFSVKVTDDFDDVKLFSKRK